MSELRIVTPEECEPSTKEKLNLVAQINDGLRGEQRSFVMSNGYAEFARRLAAESGWMTRVDPIAGSSHVEVVFLAPSPVV